jgi:hypothetical protein
MSVIAGSYFLYQNRPCSGEAFSEQFPPAACIGLFDLLKSKYLACAHGSFLLDLWVPIIECSQEEEFHGHT